MEPGKRCLASFHSPSGGPCSFANWNTRGRTPASHPALIAQHASPTAWAPRRRCRVAPPVQQCAVRCAPRRTRRALDRSAAKRHREARSSRRADPSRPCQADRGLRHRRQSSRPWLRRREYRSINGGTRPARLRASRSVRPVSRASWLNRGLSLDQKSGQPGEVEDGLVLFSFVFADLLLLHRSLTWVSTATAIEFHRGRRSKRPNRHDCRLQAPPCGGCRCQ